MGVTVRYHGHSNLEILSGSHTLQIDPFYTDNALADVKADAVKPDFILLSHAHFDHVGDTESIAQRTNATIIACFEIAQHFGRKGLKNTHGLNTGGGFNFPFGRVTMTQAFHTSSFQDGSYGGFPMGMVIETGGKTIYFAGDTALFGDMQLIGRLWKLDLACLPIGDNFTMGPKHAIEAAKLLRPGKVLPIHYNTFPPIQQDAGAFARELKAQAGLETAVLQPGETLEM